MSPSSAEYRFVLHATCQANRKQYDLITSGKHGVEFFMNFFFFHFTNLAHVSRHFPINPPPPPQ
jgi:hypothetical protein